MLALLEVRAQARSGEWDVLVVDCAPTAETLRLLALPEALGWYMTRVLPVERRVVKALKPVLSRAAGVPMPEDSVFDAIERLHADLDDVRTVLTGPDTSVRLVLTPESVVLAEARRAYTFLTLFGYSVDAAVVNRVFPEGGADDVARHLGRGAAAGARRRGGLLRRTRPAHVGLPRRPSRSGARSSSTWRARCTPTTDPLARRGRARAAGGAAEEAAAWCWRCRCRWRTATTYVSRARATSSSSSVASYRRLLTLPSGLARHRVAGARVHEGELQVRFADTAMTTEEP